MTLLVKGRTLIRHPAVEPMNDGAVLIDQSSGEILYAGPADSVPQAEGASVIDCSKHTVLPALIDTHTHITANLASGLSLEEMMSADPTTAALRGHDNLLSDLRSGVTTMRTLGDPEGVEIAFREAIGARAVEGPRLQVCARALRPTHGTAGFLATAVDGAKALRRAIRENFEAGADVVKLFVTNVMHGRRYEDYLRGDLTAVPAYTREEIAAAIDEARRLGMRTAAHAIGGDAMRDAIRAGIDSIEHANLLEDGDIELFLEHGTSLSDPNLQLFLDSETGFESLPTWDIPWWREKVAVARERTIEYVPRAIAAGVPVCLAGDSLHSVLWREAVLLENLGVPAAKVLETLTTNSAKLLGVEARLGAIEAGRIADLIAVDGDPLEDMSALGRVRLVVKEGRPLIDSISGLASSASPVSAAARA